jgi:hypothetical protein
LEHESYVSILGGYVVHQFVSDEDVPFVGLDQPCYKPEQRCFAAATWAEQGEIFFVMNV